MENFSAIKKKEELKLNQEKKLKKFLWFKIKPFDTKDQIFKIVLTGLLLSIAVGTSLIEVRIPIMGALVPLRIFDVLIIMLAIPIIGIWYSLAIAIIEPWLHLALDGDHPPIQMMFDNIANIALVLSFVLIFYKLFHFNNQDRQAASSNKRLIIKRSLAGIILVPLNAIVSSLCFALTLIVLSNSNLTMPDEYIAIIASFYKSAAAIFFILLAIELGRFIIVYILFALVQKKLGQLNRFRNN